VCVYNWIKFDFKNYIQNITNPIKEYLTNAPANTTKV